MSGDPADPGKESLSFFKKGWYLRGEAVHYPDVSGSPRLLKEKRSNNERAFISFDSHSPYLPILLVFR